MGLEPNRLLTETNFDLLTHHYAAHLAMACHEPAMASFHAAGGPGRSDGTHWDRKVGQYVPD